MPRIKVIVDEQKVTELIYDVDRVEDIGGGAIMLIVNDETSPDKKRCLAAFSPNGWRRLERID